MNLDFLDEYSPTQTKALVARLCEFFEVTSLKPSHNHNGNLAVLLGQEEYGSPLELTLDAQADEDQPRSRCKVIDENYGTNILSLYSVRHIDEDTSEGCTVFFMARNAEEAARLFHKGRARDHANEPCEVVVDLVQDCNEVDQ